jgi:HAD superfamily hydrolase (TIGR01549 family)
MNFKAVVFDYGNVLAGAPGPQAGFNLVDKLDVTRDEYFQAYFRYNKQVNRGEITWDELWRLVLTDLDRMDKLPLALQSVKEHEESLDRLNMNVMDLAVRLKQNGYKIGVISNTTVKGAERIHTKLDPYPFDAVHCSSETGKVKPDPSMFIDMATALQVDIHDMVFIDDSERSLSTAQECGYAPIQFNNYEELLSQLVSLGINTK